MGRDNVEAQALVNQRSSEDAKAGIIISEPESSFEAMESDKDSRQPA